jgi:Gamma tubulin complex component N-terminal
MSNADNMQTFVRLNMEDLARLILKIEKVPEILVTRVSRLIRFDASTEQLTQHSKAVKLKIREKIISDDMTGSAASLAKFDGTCDSLRKLNPIILTSFLAVFEPLAFTAAKGNSSISNTIITAIPSIYHGSNQVTQSKPIVDNSSFAILPKALQSLNIDKSEDAVNNDGLLWINRDTELTILTDLLFIFQGINGKHIKYDPRSESYVIDPALKHRIPPPVREIILCLCEVGWLFEKISKYTTKVEASEASGLISQAFAFSLQVTGTLIYSEKIL